MLNDFLLAHPKKYLIFDFDETLCTLQLPWEIYAKELSARLLALDPSLAAVMHAGSLNDLENEAVRRHGAAAIELRRAYSAEFETQYLRGVVEHHILTDFIRAQAAETDAVSPESVATAGTVALATTSVPKYTFYLWTSNMRSTVEPILQRKGLLQFFMQLITKSDVELTKPEPEGFYHMFDPATQRKEDFLMIGDSVNDAGAARAAGIEFFKVRNG